jgi:hypothetical protein
MMRATIVVAALAFLAQCSGSTSAAFAPEGAATTDVTTPVAETSPETVTKTTVPKSTTTNTVMTTSVPKTTSTTSTSTTVAEPTTTTIAAPVIDPNCPSTSHGAVIDRARQRAYLCFNGVALSEFPITTALDQPDPATYKVFGKTMHTFSRFGGHYSTMTHFVAFARGEKTGARVAFHTVPTLKNGDYVQPLESVGTEELHGASSGCIRVLPEEGQIVWDWLQVGDQVHVVT